MVKYIKLVLEGFGCFESRAEFHFAGGLDVFTQPNEKGKSTMLNGIVHTLFGMKKPDKDRFRSWSDTSSFTGELTLESDGVEYVIKMNFDKDKVSVKRLDESTGRPTEHLREQSHVPAGKKSEKYSRFLQEILGTSDIEVFKSAFVVEQPLKDELRLGEGGELILIEAGGLYSEAIRKLVDRLGKEATGITMNIQDYDIESSKQRLPRELELLQDELRIKQNELSRSENALNQLFPLMEEQKKANSEIARLKAAAALNSSRKQKSEQWIKLREEYLRQNRASGDKRDYYAKVSAKLEEQKNLEKDLKSLRERLLGEPIEDAAIDAVESASKTAKALLAKAEGIKKEYAGSVGLGESIAAADLLSFDAQVRLEELVESARKESAGISAAKAGLAEWEKSFGGISGASSQDRESWERAIEAIELSRRSPAANRGPYARMVLVAAGAAALIGAAYWWRTAGENPFQYVLVALSVVLLITSFFVKPGGDIEQAVPYEPEEEVKTENELRAKIALYDLMSSRPAPIVPEGADMMIKTLDAMQKDATDLIRLTAGIRQASASVGEKDLSVILELASIQFTGGQSALQGISDDVLIRARGENEKRKAHARAVAELETTVSKAGGIVKEILIAGKAESLEGLRADADAAEREAVYTLGQWRTQFEGELILKPETDIEVLQLVQDEIAKLNANETTLDDSLNAAVADLDGIKDRLRDANADKIGNIPELYEQIETIKGRIDELLFEAEAIGRAVEQLRFAGESFGEATCDSLKKSITALLEKVTGVAGRNIKVEKGFTLDVEAEGRGVSFEQLSQGTKDQLYICMRIAAAQLLGEGRNLPMFFDDSFGTTDKARLEEIRKLMTDLSEGRQFIILSHSDDISSWGRQIDVNPAL